MRLYLSVSKALKAILKYPNILRDWLLRAGNKERWRKIEINIMALKKRISKQNCVWTVRTTTKETPNMSKCCREMIVNVMVSEKW